MRTVRCSGRLGGGGCAWGACPERGVSARERYLLGGGVCLGGCTPPMDRMTNACENILFPPLLLPDGNEAKSFKSTHARIEFPATFALRVKWSYSVKVKDTRSGYSSGYWRIPGEAVQLLSFSCSFGKNLAPGLGNPGSANWQPQCN